MMPIGRVAGARLITRGTFTLASNTIEQTMFELTASQFSNSGIIQAQFNVDALTRNNTRIRVYVKPDGITYVALRDIITLNSSDQAAQYPIMGVASDIRFTMQSQTAEGAARAIPYVAMVF